eukprot:3125494-Rhodomonas_salina.1
MPCAYCTLLQTHRHRHTDTQTHRQTDTQTDRQTHRQIDRHTDTQTQTCVDRLAQYRTSHSSGISVPDIASSHGVEAGKGRAVREHRRVPSYALLRYGVSAAMRCLVLRFYGMCGTELAYRAHGGTLLCACYGKSGTERG